MKKDAKNGKLVTTLIITFLCIVFVGGLIWGIIKVSALEGTLPPVTKVEGLSKAPETEKEAAEYLTKVLNKVVEESPKATLWNSFSVDDDTLEIEGSDAFASSVKLCVGDLEDLLEEKCEDDKKESDFFADIESVLTFPDITEDEIEGFTCEYRYFVCPICGNTSEEFLDECENCHNDYDYVETYKDNYDITIALKTDGKNIDEKCFNQRTKEQIEALTADVIDGKATLSNTDVTYEGLNIHFTVNRLTDKVSNVEFVKQMKVSADVGFIGEYEKVEGGKVTFTLTEKIKQEFTWPSLSLNEHTMYVEPKTTNNLLATLTCDEPTNYTVTWTSSDESVLTVDDEGYIKSCKQDGTSAVITASFEFGGKTFSDSCEVFVRVPVESVVLKDRNETLAVGETVDLVPKVSPKDATVQTVTWYTENAEIATVDENGKVTAVAQGETKVYCLTDDGYYKSSCEVTVK